MGKGQSKKEAEQQASQETFDFGRGAVKFKIQIFFGKWPSLF